MAAQVATFTGPQERVFTPELAKGGVQLDASKTAFVMIEFQNEFCTEGGKLNGAVAESMAAQNIMANATAAVAGARTKGAKVIMCPITFKPDGSDNPNRGLGILKGCAEGELFVEGTWGAEFAEGMAPQEGDMTVVGKHGLDAFPGTNLEELLVTNGIETVVLGGFLTSCCVESTMRTAFEKGFNVVTLTDCTADTSANGYTAATTGTYGLFSTPMTSTELLGML